MTVVATLGPRFRGDERGEFAVSTAHPAEAGRQALYRDRKRV